MLRSLRLVSIFVSLVLCMLMATGCGVTRRGAKGGVTDTDVLNMDGLDQLQGDHALAGRFGEEDRITDVQFDAVLFEYDSFQIDASEMDKIRAVGDYLGANTSVRLVVEGHCDERGSREYNLSLGEHRALAVRAYLIGLGIDGDRVQTRSFGEEQPVNSDHTPEAYRENRRGEFALYR